MTKLLIDSRRLALVACAALALFALAGCKGDGDDMNDDMNDDDPSLSIDISDASNDPAATFAAATNNTIVYEDGEYMEIKFNDGDITRLLVVTPDNANSAMDKGTISGEDFKLMGRNSPVGTTVLGENELRAKFYERWGLDSDA